MNKDQGKHYRMFLNTQEYLDNHTSTWTTIPRIVSYKNDFDELMSRIIALDEEAARIVGVSKRKDTLKELLGIKVSILSGQLQAYAYDNNDLDLAKAVEITKSAVEKAKDQDLDAMIRAIVKKAQDNLTDLADYGVTEASLTEILTTLDEFNGLIGKPRIIQNEKFVKLNTLDTLFDATNELIKLKMDNVVLMFRETNPEFFDGYKRARVIVD